MAFYLIGLGMNEKSISIESLEELKKCDEIYLEKYTIDLPYEIKELEKIIGKKIIEAKREEVENEKIISNANEKNIALLVYGDPLSATTHIHLIVSLKRKEIPFKIIHNASIINLVSSTGLQIYKFGKIASMPNWKEHKNKPTSFMDYIKQNQSINAHTLLLTDINLNIKDAINQLQEASEKEKVALPEKIIVLSKAGTTQQEILYERLKDLKNKKVGLPFCIIIPSNLHFMEEEALLTLSNKNQNP